MKLTGNGSKRSWDGKFLRGETMTGIFCHKKCDKKNEKNVCNMSFIHLDEKGNCNEQYVDTKKQATLF